MSDRNPVEEYVGRRVRMNPASPCFREFLHQHQGNKGKIIEWYDNREYNTRIQWDHGNDNSYPFEAMILLDDEDKDLPFNYDFRKGYTVIMNPEHPHCEKLMEQHQGDLGVVRSNHISNVDGYVDIQWMNGFREKYIASSLTVISTEIHECMKEEVEAEKSKTEKFKYPWFPGTRVRVPKYDREAYIVDLMIGISNLKSWDSARLNVSGDWRVKIIFDDCRTTNVYYGDIEKAQDQEIKDVIKYRLKNDNVYYGIEGHETCKLVDNYVIGEGINVHSREYFNKEWRDDIVASIDTMLSNK